MRRHVNETDLALFASGDLSLWHRAVVSFHLRQCAACRDCVEGFKADGKALRSAAAEMPEGLDWTRLSSEMMANIHLGLAAGECVAPRKVRKSHSMAIPEMWRPAALATAAVMVMVLLLGAWWLNVPAQDTLALNRAVRSALHGHSVVQDRGPVIEASSDGIEFRKDGGSLSVSQDSAQLVTVSVSTQGSASAHYVDQDTGQVTVTSVYAQ